MSVITAAFQTFQKATSHTSHAGTRDAGGGHGTEVWRWRCARGRAISCMLKHQAGARTKDSTSSHLSALRRGQVPSTIVVAGGDESVVWPLARGLTSGWEIPHGDSGHEPVSCRRCGRPRARAKPCTMHAPWPRAKPVTSIRRYRARVTVKGRSPDGPAVRSGLRTRVRGSLSARRGRRGERRGSELDVRVRSRGDWSSSPDADGRRRNNTIRAERPSSVTNPQGLACTGSKKQLLHAIDNALG
jgi:hypothetical protein